ncbi:DUF4402 domain-containing protein [Novosphingobium sp.]|uniref:DUF4402 domain-containing protein n=1 Tax=Novosphingobium sp. TaxID=1874826 RepID=UPI003340D8BE
MIPRVQWHRIATLIATALWLATAGAAPALASGTQSGANGVASATVIRPLGVIALTDMDFGTITHAPGAGGTVTVSPGVAGATFGGNAGAVCAGADCALPHAAGFAVSGEPLRNYSVQLPATITAHAAGGAPALNVGTLTMRFVSGGTGPRLDQTGTDHFDVGGTITLPADLPAARYRASFVVVVSYI